MKWILLLSLLLVPGAMALQIAVSPDKIILDATGKGSVHLFNPNTVPIIYDVNGEVGELGISEQTTITQRFQGNAARIRYRNALGGNAIVLEPQLTLPIIRMQAKGRGIVFGIVFLVLVLLGLGIIYKLL